ncbi:predicted protein [Histoplasma capsulatum G186AR]|uniref:Uncharacterized protein n=1 Tax=Ajellomyces capsulatus (strain G186AR / H82 / ATCC MYA-2454 / RMSCC 2432) TaxID=447093 RepID=C0NQX2_AJECG|nr:uncharacterized protein HCBG_05402 [Histoplasma capsulatum G186AR]EEH06086.1 predicted protein [Histoplasma capsulatum G186AR]
MGEDTVPEAGERKKEAEDGEGGGGGEDDGGGGDGGGGDGAEGEDDGRWWWMARAAPSWLVCGGCVDQDTWLWLLVVVVVRAGGSKSPDAGRWTLDAGHWTLDTVEREREGLVTLARRRLRAALRRGVFPRTDSRGYTASVWASAAAAA